MKPWGLCLRLLLCAPFGCAASASSYEPAPFSHYQPILDRMPFGTLPPAAAFNTAADLEAQKTAEEEKMEQQKVAQMLTFSALNVTPRGATAVGFTDRSVNPPESYYLEVGASAHGWSVLAADYAENWAQFEKDGVTITMHLDKGLIDGPPAAGAAPVAVAMDAAPAAAPPSAPVPVPVPASAAVSASVPGLVRRPAPTVRSLPPPQLPETTDAAASAKPYLERLRERRAQEQAAKSATENATRASLQELARKIAQDEMAKRERESAAAIEELHMRQELQAAEAAEQERLREEEQKAAPEPLQDPDPEPEAEPEQ